MGDILEYCQGLLVDDNLEGIFVQNDHNNSRINKRKSDIKLKEQFIQINSTEENNISQCVSLNKLKNPNKNINSDENNRLNNNDNNNYNINNKYGNTLENELVNSVSKMTQIIEILENKNKNLENEKNEIKNENLQLLKKIEMYKDTISKLKKENFKCNYQENMNLKDKSNGNIDNKDLKDYKEEQIKIVFLFKNNKKGNELNIEPREEIMAYKYEMFIEVKLKLLNLKHLDAREIKSYTYNSKEINDWLTLEELNFCDNTYITCEYA